MLLGNAAVPVGSGAVMGGAGVTAAAVPDGAVAAPPGAHAALGVGDGAAGAPAEAGEPQAASTTTQANRAQAVARPGRILAVDCIMDSQLYVRHRHPGL